MTDHTDRRAANDEPPGHSRTGGADGGADVVHEKLSDALTPGFQAEFDPDEADHAGAFVEDGLTEQDAVASTADIEADDGQRELAFLEDDGPSHDLPDRITTTNARELFGLRPGETVAEAAARQAGEG